MICNQAASRVSQKCMQVLQLLYCDHHLVQLLTELDDFLGRWRTQRNCGRGTVGGRAGGVQGGPKGTALARFVQLCW